MLHRLALFTLSLLTLISIAFLEKTGFALRHTELHSHLAITDVAQILLWGIQFDLAIAALFTFLAYLLAQLLSYLLSSHFSQLLRWTTLIAAACLILLQGADSLYYGEAGRHIGYELKEGVNSGAALLLSALTTYTFSVVIQSLAIVAVYFWTGFIFKRFKDQAQPSSGKRIAMELMLLPLLILSAALIRGEEQIPLEPLHAQRIGDSKHATLAMNGAYNAIHASITPHTLNPVFATEPNSEQLALVKEMYRGSDKLPFATPEKRDVIFILLESWSGSYMAPYGHDKVTTPHFDQLRLEGLTTRAMLAGGRRTTEGMFTTFCSAQNPLGNTVAQGQLQSYEYHCLPKILKEAGWNTAFFQGTFKETSGTGSFAQLLGFSKSYGKEDYDPAEARYEQHSWGYHDPDIYRFTLNKLRSLPRPFMVGINTNSTHDAQLPPGEEVLIPGDSPHIRYQNILHFADQALMEFVQTVRNDPELKETIFVLVADHSGPTPPEPMQQHLIPFAILANGLEPKRLNTIATQRDIAPTLLQLLHIDSPAHFTGQSLLANSKSTHAADYYHEGTLGWVEDNLSVEFSITAPEKITCYSLEKGLQTDTPIPCETRGKAMQERALAFTHISQSLLFNGELARFSQLR